MNVEFARILPMENQPALSPEEVKTLVALLAKSSEKAGVTLTWNDLLGQWGRFVAAVEKGYQDNFQQYMKDIAVRNRIEDVLRKAPDPLTSKLAAMVRPTDDRFHAATRSLQQPISAGMTKWASPWWARVPRKLLGELESDLRAEGIFKD